MAVAVTAVPDDVPVSPRSSVRSALPRSTFILLSVLLTPLAALAQSLTLVEGSPQTLSRIDCTASNPPEVAVRWVGSANAGKERVFVSKNDRCPTDAAADQEIVLVATRPIVVSESASISRGVNAAELFALATGSEDTCGGVAGVETRVFVCVVYSETLTGTDLTESLPIQLDSTPPAAPESVTTAPLNNGLLVNWTMPTELAGAARYNLYVTPPTGDAIVKTFEGPGLRQGRITGLENGTEYTVEVTSVDDAGSTASAGNESARSQAAVGTPVESVDFWTHYHDAGGEEAGGCASTGSTGLLAVAVLLAFMQRRRVQLAVLVAVMTQAPTAFALLEPEPNPLLHSPRFGSFELRMGGYYPNVDDEPGLTGTPFADIFESDSSLLLRAEIDVDVVHFLGRWGIGASIGWARFSGKARLLDGTQANDETTFSVLPLTPLIYYRADFLDTYWNIPLIPYGKVGYGFAYWSTKLDGKQSNDPLPDGTERKGSGWAHGLELSAGLQLVLDWLQPDQAAELDQEFGINSTSLYFDVTWVRWQGNPLLLQDTVFSGGLLLAF